MIFEAMSNMIISYYRYSVLFSNVMITVKSILTANIIKLKKYEINTLNHIFHSTKMKYSQYTINFKTLVYLLKLNTIIYSKAI